MALTRASLKLLITANLHLTPGSYTTVSNSTDPNYQDTEIDNAIEVADEAVVGAILDTPGHRSRSQYRKLVSIANGGEILKAFEGGVFIDGTPGKPVSSATLTGIQEDNLSLTTGTKYFNISGGIFTFTGSSAQVEVVDSSTITPGSSGLLSPDEYQHAVLAGALSILWTKDGTNIEAANHYTDQYVAMLKMIHESMVALPAVTFFTGGK